MQAHLGASSESCCFTKTVRQSCGHAPVRRSALARVLNKFNTLKHDESRETPRRKVPHSLASRVSTSAPRPGPRGATWSHTRGPGGQEMARAAPTLRLSVSLQDGLDPMRRATGPPGTQNDRS